MILELKNIDKSFGEKEVLKGVSFTAEGGKAFGLLGRNGAGKTTSIRIIMYVFPANGGEALLDGKPIDYNKIGLAWYEIFISIIILIGSTVGIGVLSAKIYRVGVLLYGTPPKFTKIIKEVFKK